MDFEIPGITTVFAGIRIRSSGGAVQSTRKPSLKGSVTCVLAKWLLRNNKHGQGEMSISWNEALVQFVYQATGGPENNQHPPAPPR
jgi:hypothetical protein